MVAGAVKTVPAVVCIPHNKNFHSTVVEIDGTAYWCFGVKNSGVMTSPVGIGHLAVADWTETTLPRSLL